MLLTLLVFRNSSQLSAKSPTLVDPAHCATLSGLGTDIFLVAVDTLGAETIYKWIDLVGRHPIIQSLTSWDTVHDLLEGLPQVTIPVPTHYKTNQTLDELGGVIGEEYAITAVSPHYIPLKIHAVDSTQIAEVYYDSFTGSPYYYSKPFLRSKQDVRFDLSAQPFHPVPTNLVPCCGGSLYYPFVEGDNVYALGARKTLQSTFIDTPENLLIDFTPWGGMRTISFSECEVKINHDKSVEVNIPEMAGLEDTAYMLVLAGKIFLNGEGGLRRITDRNFKLPSSLVWSGGYRLSEARETNRTRWGTVQVQCLNFNPNSIDDLRTSPTNFIIILNTKNVYQIKSAMTTKYGEYAVRFPKQSSGLLREKITRAIRDYVISDFDNGGLISLSRYPEMWMPKNTSARHDMRTVAALGVRDSRQQYVNLSHQGWELVEFVIPQE